ncbi:hypothetical protein MMC26_000349 [Xylographa opegraphella]|nr:hypothetical protein [Xylographa opegraphella]
MSDTKQAGPPDEAPPSYEVAAKPIAAPARTLPLRAPLPLDLPVLNALRGKRVILASASPRRKQLLAQIGLTNLEVIPSTVPEAFPKSLSPFEYVLQTATQKATTIYAAELNNTRLGEPALIIAADTVVVTLLGQILEKPRSEVQHIAMLKSLRDTGAHKVFTAVVVMAPLESAQDPGYALQTSVEETTVRFDKEVTDDMIVAYVKTREGADKAGGYGIQGIGAILVEKIEGSFDNVVGLPLRVTLRLIEKVLDEAIDEEFTAFEDDEEA